MKKIIAFVLFFFLVCSVKADYVKYGVNNYVIQKEFYCGNKKVVPEKYIEKSGKLEVRYDDGINEPTYYIWNSDNTCEDYTKQDILDSFNSPNHFYTIGDYDNGFYDLTYHYSDVLYTEAYIKATGSFDVNETYYQDGGFFGTVVKVDEPSADNLSDYYVMIYLKHPATAIYDASKTYYTYPDHFSSKTEIANDVTNENIDEYFVKTTLNEINYTEKTTKIGSMLYDILRYNGNGYEMGLIKDKVVIKTFSSSNVIYYYDNEGTEFEQYRGYNIGVNNNYSILVKSDNSKIIVYDNTENNIIYEKNYDSTIQYSSFKYTDNSVIIYDYVMTGEDPELVATYINMYKPLNGDNQTYKGNNITIKFNGNYNEFKELRINDTVVSTNKYSVSKGSTIITLKKEYLNTLNTGSYTVKAIYKDGGIAVSTFTINGINNPQTSDNINLYIISSIISFIGICLLIKLKSKTN